MNSVMFHIVSGSSIFDLVRKIRLVSTDAAKAPIPLVSPRDFVSLRTRVFNYAQQEFMILIHSVNHPDRPEVPRIVRANVIFTFFHVSKGENGCQLVYVSQTDPGGKIKKKTIMLVVLTNDHQKFRVFSCICN